MAALEDQRALQFQCCNYLRRAFQKLGISLDEEHYRELARLVLQPMVGPWRFFHTFEHVLLVGDQEDPIEMLAGAFHDLVYVQVDTGIPFNLAKFLTPSVHQLDQGMVLRRELPDDPTVLWLIDLFEFQPGQLLSPHQGQNEFLSALVAVKALDPYLVIGERLAIAVCIEATIPFRNENQPDDLPEQMLTRLNNICKRYKLPVSRAERVEMVRRSVRVANRDVMGFAKSSAAHFLADTWNLLPENNHQFSPAGHHRVCDYRNAIAETEAFFQRVQSDSIFHQFRGEPKREQFEQWQLQAEHNLRVGRLYLTCKLVAIILLEAVAVPFGSQTTLEFFMGHLPDKDLTPELRLEQFFPAPQPPSTQLSAIEAEVWLLLSEGRAASSYQGDLVNSPLAAFLIQFHGFDSLAKQRQASKEWLAGNLSHAAFLQQFNPRFLTALIHAVQQLWSERQQALETYFSSQLETPVQSESGGWDRQVATRSQ